MGKIYDGDRRASSAAWVERQHLFFVATAPLAADGHVNVSPKGDLRWFRILGPREVAYLDFVGSGAETIAHARENGRIVVMFCAFDGPPRIVRLHGRATGAAAREPRRGSTELASRRFDRRRGRTTVRSAVIRVDVDAHRRTSCGYGVPLMRLSTGCRAQQHDLRGVRQAGARRRAARTRTSARELNAEPASTGCPAIDPRFADVAPRLAEAAAARRLDPDDVARAQLPRHLRRLLLAVDERAAGRAVARRRARRAARARAARRAPRAGSPRARAARARRRRRRGARPRRPSRAQLASARRAADTTSSSASTGVMSVFDIATWTPDGPSASGHAPWPPPIVS